MRLYSDIHADDLNAGVLPTTRPDWLSILSALCIGVVMTLCVYGYQFGRSNHTIYLLDAFHRFHPDLLTQDWFTTKTFHYHAAFGFITRTLMQAGLLEIGFLTGYLGLVILFHIAWLKLVLAVGGTLRTYLVSVLFYYLSAGGTALGIYQFFQDSSFLASNIANVALLWAFYLWIVDKRVWSGLCFGLAGMFHLNHALVGVGAWVALNAWDWITRPPVTPMNIQSLVIKLDPVQAAKKRRADVRAWIAAIVPSLFNIGMGLYLQLQRGAKLPMQEFVEIYVKFRHPHHYDPRSWPLALWICFFWAIPLAAMAYHMLKRRADRPLARRARRETVRVFLLIAGLQIVALLGAGLFYVNESLIQMSLYRFSIYCQLFACIGAALLICDCTRLAGTSVRALLIVFCAIIAATPMLLWIGPRIGWINIEGVRAFINAKRPALTLFFILSCAPALHELIAILRTRALRNGLNIAISVFFVGLIVVGWNKWIGLTLILDKSDPDYIKMAEFARDNTPKDAIFLVPPNESDFRLAAQRAIVVNFKAVPQLGGELKEWAQRLRDELNVTDLHRQLPHGFDKVGRAMNDLYRKRTGEELESVAKKYDAQFVLTNRPLEAPYDGKLIHETAEKYYLYDLAK